MNDTALHFAQPVWIAAGAVACALVAALWFRFDRRRDADLAKLIHPRFRQKLTEGFSPRLRMLKRMLWLVALFLTFLAVARPQKGYEWREVKRKGIDILFAVDTSRSMLAEDLSPNRLERARLGILDFVAKLEGDRVGLIPFAGTSFALCPLTLDYDAFRESLNALDTDLIPKQGTDLASAIKEAERLFDEAANNHRVLVLLTDGEDLQGSAMEAAKEAGKKGMAIYTIGVGSPEGARIPIDLGYGRKDFVRDANGNVVQTKLDESTLKQIAEATNAMYVPLGRGAEGLETIYDERLRLVPKSEMNQRMERIPLERFEWPLGAAIALLLVEFFIPDRLRAKKARPLPSAARLTRPAALLGTVLLSLQAAPDSRAAETVSNKSDPRQVYNQGTEAYSKGDFAKAADSLNASLKTQDLALQQKSYYNLGNTLYRTGQGTLEKDAEATIKSWEKAIKAYQDALALDAKDGDARYNEELVKKKLEELKKQQKQDSKDDKKQDKGDNKDQKDDKDQKDQKQDKDGQKDQQDQKDGKKDQKDQKDQGKPDDQKGDQGEKKDQQDGKESGEQDKKDGSQQQQDSKDGKEGEDKKQEGQKPGEKEGEKKDGKQDSKQDGKQSDASQEKDGKEPKEGEAGEKQDEAKDGEKQEGTMNEARGERQQMSPEEAKQMLEALRQDERTVIPIPQPQRRSRFVTPENSTKGKTW